MGFICTVVFNGNNILMIYSNFRIKIMHRFNYMTGIIESNMQSTRLHNADKGT